MSVRHHVSYFACGIHAKAKCACVSRDGRPLERNEVVTDVHCPAIHCEDPDGAKRKAKGDKP